MQLSDVLVPSNRVIAELLARASEKEKDDQRRRALRRASRAAFAWEREAAELVASGARFTALPRVGPWIAHEIERLSAEYPDVEPPPLRRGFLTWSEAAPAAASLQVRGDLQAHTTWSDGHSSLSDMAAAAVDAQYEYLLITDHTKGLPIANGMDEAQLREQWREVALVQETLAVRLLRGVEMNIGLSGEGDMDEAVLDECDVILGAFHSQLRRKEDQTERYLAALRNPYVDVLAHPRCRMYNFRIGLSADWPRVFAEAARLDKAIEVDGYPDRQDVDLDLLRVAVESGVRISLGSDSHHAVDIPYLTYARGAAVLADVPAERVINCLSADDLCAWAAQHRGRA